MNGETKETGFYADIKRKLKQINGARIDIGWFEESQYLRRKILNKKIDVPLKEPIPMGRVAFWLDKGTRHIRERPFLSIILIEHRVKYAELSRSIAFECLEGRRTVKESLKRIGSVIEGDLKLKITDIRTPPNSPEWEKIKGFNNPLILNGWLKANAKFKLRKIRV